MADNLTIFRKVKVFLICLVMVTLVGAFAFSSEVFAAGAQKTVIDSRSMTLASGESMEIPFTTNEKMIFMTVVDIVFKKNPDIENLWVESGGIKVKLVDANGNVIQDDYNGMIDWFEDDEFHNWWYSDNYFQEPGSYTYIISNTTDMDWDIRCTLNGYTGYATKGTFSKTKSVKRGNWIKIGKMGTGYPRVISFKSSKPKVVKAYSVEDDGTIYVRGKGLGKSKITIKLKGGKKYTTTVTVKPKDPDVYACLYDYNTRNNYFKVKVKNNGDRTIYVIRKGAKAVNVDYKSFDRYMKASKNVAIKPGKTKYVYFYCKGRTTWYDYEDFTIYAKFKSEGKTYSWHVWDENSVLKKGKKWYTTYWDEDDYESWNPNIDYDDEDYDDEDYDEDYDDEEYDDEYDDDYDYYDDEA